MGWVVASSSPYGETSVSVVPSTGQEPVVEMSLTLPPIGRARLTNQVW